MVAILTIVRVLRTCQKIYFEARSIFFASKLFDFDAVLFRDSYYRFLRPQPHGFDPAKHVKYLVLRGSEMRSDTPSSQWKCAFLENLKLWRDTLALFRSSRWNLERLFVENFNLDKLHKGEFPNESRPNFFRLPMLGQGREANSRPILENRRILL